MHRIAALVILVVLVNLGSSQSQRSRSALLENYDNSLLPSTAADSPTVVIVNLFVRQPPHIDEQKMEWTVQIAFREEWNDTRLRTGRQLQLDDASKIWTPDVFFQNEKTGHHHTIMQPNRFARVSADGQVLLSTRLTLTLACKLDLHYYPFDEQRCNITFGSYGHSKEDIRFLWREMAPVQLPENQVGGEYYIFGNAVTSRSIQQTPSGDYDSLTATLTFRRGTAHYWYRHFIPTIGLVMMSWVVFFLGTALPLRIALAFVTLQFTMVTVLAAGGNWPKLSYFTGMDVWRTGCFLFILASFLESAFVLKKSKEIEEKRKQDEEARKRRMAETPNDTIILDEKQAFIRQEFDTVAAPETDRTTEGKRGIFSLPTNPADRTDYLARIGFPTAFAIFCMIFFLTYHYSN